MVPAPNSPSGRRSSTSRTNGNGTSCRKIAPSVLTQVCIANGPMCWTTSNVVTGLPSQLIKLRLAHLGAHIVDLTGERIDDPRLPPLAHVQPGQSIERTEHVVHDAARLVGEISVWFRIGTGPLETISIFVPLS